MRVHYVLHADFELPGVIGHWAREQRFGQTRSRPFAGERLPPVTDFDLLVVMGGPQSPLTLAETPYLADEIALIAQALRRNIPVLGFCLGAQLIGEALGAPAERSPNREVGIFPIELTAAGRADPLLSGLPEKFPVVHWHNDMPGLTSDACVLATSEGCPRQIVRYTPLAYGFQCHPEALRENLELMVRNCPDDLKAGRYVQSAAELAAADTAQINAHMRKVLNNLLAVVG